MKSSGWFDFFMYFVVAFLTFPVAAQAASCPSGNAIYTSADATQGRTDYNNECAACHNGDLSGNSGPALAGSKFESYLEFTKISAQQLYGFIAEQMPANNPGGLSKTQYDDIFAYILSYNHYPSGDVGIKSQDLSCLSMLPYPKAQN
ncbi:c-type cytochrome [Acidocella aminolytica]|jgi:mono/diheme cytochrome c family protein|uniref:Cytochrome c n=1 Tax=Acidocella aminolytica 101 = DSM 11237 TaxID=1120923 RepID=A0A0D6PIA0_9PROT|nr:cytochrome c [Acidocella aminolytica]GAN81382.1 cytochrome c [Acidocella aminolytica 101 = DSM 11237]GBQ40837.1 putative cytochrome c [Acidocella aminolytica 101 = DSM 11237]SHF32356.1 Cytochrome C oxidase, cbb3-type, subunit III [Acidocella aminolytica 101 = DSM 11237]